MIRLGVIDYRTFARWKFRTTAACSRSTSAVPQQHQHNTTTTSRQSLYLITFVIGVSFVPTCLLLRKYRHQLIEELPMATTVLPIQEQKELTRLALRNSLMGRGKSVKDDLEDIRKWHLEYGYKGGLVIRELDKPLFWTDETTTTNTSNREGSTVETASLEDLILDPMRLARHECYYLYYELHGNGQLHQEIFCRGTTLWVDILTCMQAWMTYDEDLQCKVHHGFRAHANRLLKDLQPILAKDPRATIEVSGHSLGGAVAYLLAVKLRKRGFNVIKLTAFGSPRFCGWHDPDDINALLPLNNLRVENDNDFVAYLPPFGTHVGNKLWFPQYHAPRYVASTKTQWWTDSFWFNFRLWEIAKTAGKAHRVVPNYKQQLEHMSVETPD